jgi:hypothetical protein
MCWFTSDTMDFIWSACALLFLVLLYLCIWHVLYPVACWPVWIYGIWNKYQISNTNAPSASLSWYQANVLFVTLTVMFIKRTVVFIAAFHLSSHVRECWSSHCSVRHTNVCVGPEKGLLCAGCGGRAVVVGSNLSGALPVPDCPTGRAAAKKNGRCSVVVSSSSHVRAKKVERWYLRPLASAAGYIETDCVGCWFHWEWLLASVILRLTVGQVVCLGVDPNLGLIPRCLLTVWQSQSCSIRASSLTRGRVCLLSVIV